MSKFPIALSIVVLCLLIAIGQNLSPSVSIVFLGTTSIALPLGIWVGLAISAGILTAIAISTLFRGVGSSRSKVPRASIGASTPSPAPDRAQRTWDDRTVAEPMGDRSDTPLEATTDPAYEPLVPGETRTGQLHEDGQAEAWDNEEEWVGTDVAQRKTDEIYPQDDGVKPPGFEMKQEPIPTYQEGSMYSYSYRDDKTETGKADDIYAAADDEGNDVPRATPEPPEEEPLEPERVDPFPDPFETFEADRPQPSSERSGKSLASEDGDDWMNSSKANRDDW
ncbi:hypothetical protein IQ235_04140 [Oscillatoriales cyanobacterium LEGE 11467]|uniref:Lipopolysaccharide assembly protein A domain-containing protein n=1 Tax=Zarconia navalis LEGE 11467 TaxID=1828826 RepID=A0A928VTQ6_9CYAN|nr:hypothetical protein [Zarconia navalis]MBE9039981.1 hypothetical protein [Zarconia navalis LEGE 11467]